MLSASCSDRRAALAALTVACCALLAPPVGARVLVSQQQALREAFGDARVERVDAFLTDEQAARIKALAGTPPSSQVVSYYVARREGRTVGTAYFDTHLVRTFPETVMIVIGPSGTVARVEVISFDEPAEYLPRERWFDLFPGRGLDRDLVAGRGVPVVTGATLTSRAVVAATRRALAVHRLLFPEGTEPPARPPAGGQGRDERTPGEDRR